MKKKTSAIDLRKCKPGDRLRTAHGLIVRYVLHQKDSAYPHVIRYSDGQMGTRMDDGQVYIRPDMRRVDDHVIVKILPRGKR